MSGSKQPRIGSQFSLDSWGKNINNKMQKTMHIYIKQYIHEIHIYYTFQNKMFFLALWNLCKKTCISNSFLLLFSRDAKCGKIQCQGGANRPVIGTNAVSIETNIPLQEGGRILCRGTHVYLGDDMPDPGLVLTGTKCGENMVKRVNNEKVFI